MEKAFKKNSTFLDYIPDNITEYLIENCVVVFDDQQDLLCSKKYAPMIISMASYLIHHKNISCICVFQTFELFYAKNRLHSILHQCNILILFKNMSTPNVLRRIINNFNVQFSKNGEKTDDTVFDLYKRHVNSRFKYLVINLSNNLDRPLLYSGFLYGSDENYVVFN